MRKLPNPFIGGVAILCSLMMTPLQARPGRIISDADVKRYADGVLALMSYTVTPDVTTSNLSITNSASDNPGLSMTQFGGGFTVSRTMPLYLEGNASYSRYDPTFVATEGQQQRELPVRWNSVTATGGIGWDFPIIKNLVLRPIFNFTFGYMASDLKVAETVIDSKVAADVNFLDGGKMSAYGLGGSVMLDYEDYLPDREIDVEMRYTNVGLHSHGNSSEAVQGSADAETASLWARWRAPTGLIAMERPVRYVLEYARTEFMSPSTRVLGFDALNSVGVGLELDSTKYNVIATRWRAVLRHSFGDNVKGWSLGLAVSF